MLGSADECPAGSVEWAERISRRLQLAVDSLSRDTVHHLQRCIKQIWEADPRPWDIWPPEQPYRTPDDYCRAVTGHSWKILLELMKEMGNGQLGFDFRDMEAELARAQKKYRSQGTRTDLLGANITKLAKGKGSTQSAYLLRRLARDFPIILARYEKGEFKSVRAAAIEANIIKIPTPYELILKLLLKLSNEEREKLKAILND